MPPRFDAVLFDLDGTLIDSRADIAASVNHARGAFGLPPLSVEIIQTYVGDGVRLLMERSLGTADAALVERAIALWRPHYTAHCLDRTGLYPGVPGLLDALSREGVRLGIVSNKPVLPSEMILAGLGIRKLFSAVVGGDTTHARKPDPEPLRLAAERAGAGSARVLMVGDSPNDVEGARRAGFASCAVLWGIGRENDLRATRPDHVAATPSDVAAVAGLTG